jgi:hypothetical protein
MRANETAGRCACGKELLDRDTWQCGACARKDVARRAEASIEGVQRYRRDGEAEGDFIARLESQCPQCRAMLDRPGVPGRRVRTARTWAFKRSVSGTQGILRIPADPPIPSNHKDA